MKFMFIRMKIKYKDGELTMGFALYTERCPQCGGVCWVQERNSSGTFFLDCERCGWKCSRLSYEDTWDEKKGYGVVCITYGDGDTDFVRIEEPPDVEKITSCLAMLDHEYLDEDKSYFTLWNEETQNVIAIFGSRPPDFKYSRAF